MPKLKTLSNSRLSIFRDCPACFWLAEMKGIKRPRGIFPSLPGGMDLVIKKHYDSHRAKGILPPEIHGKVPYRLFQKQNVMDQWREWRTGLSFDIDGVKIIGALDDALIREEDDAFSPLDYKTRGSAPKGDGSQYYGMQMDLYGLQFRKSNRITTGDAYLVYYYPATCGDAIPEMVDFKFDVKVYRLDCVPDRAEQAVIDAIKCAQLSTMPDPSPSCEQCNYAMTSSVYRKNTSFTQAG